MQAVPPGTTRRIAQLDSLRGVAALFVVLHHALQAYARSTEDTMTGLAGHLDVGRLGVVIFFMISGFVIVKAVPGHDAAAARTFARHRFFRLYPPFWVSVAVAIVVAGLVGHSACCAFAVPATPARIVANLTMFPLRFHQTMLIGIYWTLELEMAFYTLVVAIALSRRTSYGTMWLASSVLLVAAMATAGSRAWAHGANDIGKDDVFLALLHLSLMFSGAAVRCYWDRLSTRATFFAAMPTTLKLYYLVVALFFSGVAAIKIRHGLDAHTFRVAATYLLSIVGFLMCLRYGDGSWLGTFLGNRSYGVYLLHLPVVSLVSLALTRWPAVHVSVVGYVALVMMLSLASADVLRRLVERPMIRFAHRTERGRRPTRDRAAAAAISRVDESLSALSR